MVQPRVSVRNAFDSGVFKQPLPLDALRVHAVAYCGAATAANSCPRPCSSRRTLVSVTPGYAPAERLWSPLPAVGLPPRLRLPHLLPPPKLVPARLSIGRNTLPSLLQQSPSDSSDNCGTASLLRQGWVALASHQSPCP